jgi:thymidylate synthase
MSIATPNGTYIGLDQINHPEYQYLNLCHQVLTDGTLQANRTTKRAWTIDGGMMQFRMSDGFPLLTTKKMAYKKGFAEQIGFLRGLDNAYAFAELGCDWWFKDANENTQWLASPHRKGDGDLGRIYGKQWREWRGKVKLAQPVFTGKTEEHLTGHVQIEYETIDQVQVALDLIRNNPTNRRIIINGWRPDEFDQMALPPCHVAYEFLVNVEKGELNMTMWQRSCDMFLGVPMNIANSALMLHLFSAATGLTPGRFTHFLSDVHIYENHVDQVREQLTRTPMKLPTLVMCHEKDALTWTADDMAAMDPQDIFVTDYASHPAIKGEMSTG